MADRRSENFGITGLRSWADDLVRSLIGEAPPAKVTKAAKRAPAKTGRPEGNDRRLHVMCVRVRKDERTMLKRAAAKRGLTFSGLVRGKLLNG